MANYQEDAAKINQGSDSLWEILERQNAELHRQRGALRTIYHTIYGQQKSDDAEEKKLGGSRTNLVGIIESNTRFIWENSEYIRAIGNNIGIVFSQQPKAEEGGGQKGSGSNNV